MFMDRHDAVDATPEAIADAHKQDLAVQEQYGVRYVSYWFDPERHTVFCLAEGPNRETVERVHAEAHGLMADAIVEIDENVPLNSFFDTIPTHPAGTAYTAAAMQAIVFTDITGSVAQTHALGDDGHLRLLADHDEIVRGELAAHGGREVKHTGDGIMAAFSSVAAAVAFSIAVQRRLDERNEAAEFPLQVSIGISAGEPVTNGNDDLFGAAVQLAARLCAAVDGGEIGTSLVVRELCVGKQFTFEDRGFVDLKGVPEPMQVYGVAWRADS
jgi:class 3 adenylate cyclase